MANFYLVRHRIPGWVEDQVLYGITDIPLNMKGKIQAKETTRSLREYDARKIYELD